MMFIFQGVVIRRYSENEIVAAFQLSSPHGPYQKTNLDPLHEPGRHVSTVLFLHPAPLKRRAFGYFHLISGWYTLRAG